MGSVATYFERFKQLKILPDSCKTIVSAALHLTEPWWRGSQPDRGRVSVRVHRYAPAVAPLLTSLLEAGALSLAGGGAESARRQCHLPARPALPRQSAGHATQRYVHHYL